MRYWYSISSSAEYDTIFRHEKQIDRDESILNLRKHGLNAEVIAATDPRVRKALRVGFDENWLGSEPVKIPRMAKSDANDVNRAIQTVISILEPEEHSSIIQVLEHIRCDSAGSNGCL